MTYANDLREIADSFEKDMEQYRAYRGVTVGAEMRLRKLIEALPNSTSGKLTAELRNIHDILSFKD